MAEYTPTINGGEYFAPSQTGVSTMTATPQVNAISTASTIDAVANSIVKNAETYGQTGHKVVIRRYAIKRG